MEENKEEKKEENKEEKEEDKKEELKSDKKESKEDLKKAEKLKKEEMKRKKKEEKEAKKREEKALKEEKKRLKKEQKAKEKELRESLNKSTKSSKKSGHMKLQSSVQFLPSNISNFDFIQNELPESFYEDVLINEMELSEEFSIEKLSNLIKLYSQAMEYYLQNDPPKAKDYQGRMEFLLTNKDTLRKLKKQSENLTINKNVNSSARNTEILDTHLIRNNKALSEMKKNVEFQTDNLMFDDILNKVSIVMGENKGKGELEATKNLIQKDLEKQNMSWKEKLKHKKKGMLRGSMTFLNNRGANPDLMKSKTLNVKSSTDEKLNLGNKKLEKMKFIFNDDLYEEVKEVKEENEPEGSDKENDDKKEQIIDNFEDFNIVNNDEDDKKEDEKEEEKKEVKKEIIEEKKEEKKEIKIEPKKRRKSIVDKDVTRKVDIDEKILTSVNQKMDLLLKLIDDIEKNKLKDEDEEENPDMEIIENKENNIIIENNSDNKNQIISDEKKEKEKNILSEIQTDVINIPVKFQSTYYQVESIMQSYMDDFNNFYYKDIFEQFASNLKEIYDNKYKKYIDISIEYHNQIKENEHILENNDNLSEEKKNEINQIIDSLKDEQQNQIAKIEDEFNRLIVSKVNEFKINSFKNNSGIQLMEEQLKLDIYSLINESFY